MQYNFLIRCTNQTCSRFNACERPLSERDAVNYKHICNENNGFAMWVEFKVEKSVEEEQKLVDESATDSEIIKE